MCEIHSDPAISTKRYWPTLGKKSERVTELYRGPKIDLARLRDQAV